MPPCSERSKRTAVMRDRASVERDTCCRAWCAALIAANDVEDHAELLLEQVSSIERCVELGNHGQLGGQGRGEVLGVSQQRPAAAFELAGRYLLARTADRIPDLSAHFVERVGRPLDHMEGIQADGG